MQANKVRWHRQRCCPAASAWWTVVQELDSWKGWTWEASADCLPGGASLDSLCVPGALKNRVDEYPRCMHLIRRKLAGLEKLFHFSDDVVGSGGRHGIKIAGGFAIDKIAPAVALPRLDESEVAPEAVLKDAVASIEIARFLAFGDHGAVAGRRVEGGDAGASRAEAFRKRALWIQFYVQFAAQNELLEQFVFSNVSRNHFLDLAILQQQANAEVVHTGVVAHNCQVPGAVASQRLNEIFGNATQAKSAHKDGHAIAQIRQCHIGRCNAFIHGKYPRRSLPQMRERPKLAAPNSTGHWASGRIG